MSLNKTLTEEDLPEGYQADDALASAELGLNQASEQLSSLNIAEQKTIEIAIKKFGGNITQAAKYLHIAKGTLYRKMKKYNLENHR